MQLPLKSADVAIVDIVSRYPNNTIPQIHKHLSKETDVAIALSNLYKPINRLLEDGILQNVDNALHINPDWLLSLEQFARRLRSNHDGVVSYSLQEGEGRETILETFSAFQDYWWRAFGPVMRLAKERVYYSYCSHSFWRPAAMFRKFGDRVPEDFRVCALIGNDTVLDRHGCTVSNSLGNEVTVVTDTSYPKEGYSLWVCDDYILEYFYPPELSQAFKTLFSTVSSIRDFDPEELRAIHARYSPRRAVIRRNAEESVKHRNMIKEYFLGNLSTERKRHSDDCTGE